MSENYEGEGFSGVSARPSAEEAARKALYTREQDLLLREQELNAREQGTRKAPTFSFPFGRIISGIVVVLGVVMVVWAIGALDAPLKVLFNGKVPTAYGCAFVRETVTSSRRNRTGGLNTVSAPVGDIVWANCNGPLGGTYGTRTNDGGGAFHDGGIIGGEPKE